MQKAVLNSQLIESNGWNQGACLLIDQHKEIYITTLCMQERLPDGLYIVLSQDCDVLNGNIEKESVVELIEATRLPKINTEFLAGKNPRQLHLELIEQNCCLELLPHKRLFIARSYLEAFQADTLFLTGKSLKLLLNWITKRYKRPGFPDAFNRRIDSKVIKRIKTILSEKAINTLGLFIRLSPEQELSPSETYKILVKMLVTKDIYEVESNLPNIEDGFDQILLLLEGVKNLEVIEGLQVQSMDSITANDFYELKQWDFDYISFQNDNDGETVTLFS